jgi:hypothetical protein
MEQRIGDDQTEHSVAEELQRLVVRDSTRRVFGGARLVRQRMFEQTAVAKAVVDPRLQVVELVAQTHHPRSDVLAMTVDDAPRVLGCGIRDGHANLPERAHGHRPDSLRVPRRTDGLDAVAIEQRHDDTRLDVGRGGEYDDHV